MKHHIECIPTDDHLYLRIGGIWLRENARDIIKEISNFSEQNPGLPLLIDVCDMKSDVSTFNDFDDVHIFIEMHFRKLGRIAVIDRDNRKKHNEFFETAANNRGLRIRFFYTDRQEALSWLL